MLYVVQNLVKLLHGHYIIKINQLIYLKLNMDVLWNKFKMIKIMIHNFGLFQIMKYHFILLHHGHVYKYIN